MSGLLVTGTSSDAGKSLVVTGLCRAFARRGLSVAPYKAQNMSNHSMVCRDGAEIGRAQYLQAQAAGVEATSAMNPVLLKPGSDRRAHVIVRGRPAGELRAGEYATGRTHLAEAAFAAYDELASQVDLVVCEGAGSPAEINLRAGDYVNLGLAQRFSLPTVLVGDIDRGGVLAALYGTWALVDDADRARLAGFVINKFRGDASVLTPGLDEITRRTGMPSFGVLPWLEDVWLDSEDALSVGAWGTSDDGVPADRRLSVAVVRFPRTSNATDVDALAAEPGLDVRVTRDADTVREADLVVLPGSRATTSDLSWLRASGLADVVLERARRGAPVLGICGGYQMLLDEIVDDGIEATDTTTATTTMSEGRSATTVAGLGLLPGRVVFGADKVLARPSGTWRGHPVEGYEIHHGVVTPGERADVTEFPGGHAVGAVHGSIWHGTLEGDDFRRAFLADVAAATGSAWRAQAGGATFASRREAMIDSLADALETHVDVDAVLTLALESR
ncbi:cobyric acid synthase [Janibacter sp. G1551]|uniref:cobyric acid synthase n=1 Tax=Janibacter sp. G1551 TaxID=3420440 RepID=UPI003CFBD567